MFLRKLTRPIAIAAAAIGIGAGTYGIVSATTGNGSGTATTAISPAARSGQPVPGRAGSNARSGPAPGGVAGTVDSVSTTSLALATSAGQNVTVNTDSSTTYGKGTSTISADTIKKGDSVIVLGITDGATIAASEIIVEPADGSGSNTSSPAKVIAFQRGAPSTSKQVGQIPANYTEGSGTIVNGTTANKATEAALTAYPGGIVDRVVKLSNGAYEVHNIGVNWPHHIFVNPNFKVVGAD